MSKTGRFFIVDPKSGRKFCVEPIDNSERPADWGDIDPVTKKLTGHYGKKHTGSIKESESIITEENGFKNIVMLEAGQNPMDYVEKLLKEKND